MPSISGPATRKDFFNRTKELERILRSLREDNVLLIAPRRYGKTSLMREIERVLIEQGYNCLFLDIMYIDEPKEFIIELADAVFIESSGSVRKKILGFLKEAFERVEEVDASSMGSTVRVKFRNVLKDELDDDNWPEKGKEIFRAIIDACDSKPVYIIIDELSECVSNMVNGGRGDAKKFLQWFRGIRQQMKGKLGFLVGGSVSFERVARGINGLSWINDFRRDHVEGFSKVDSLRFVERSLTDEGLSYSEEVGEKILACIGEPYIPYFISVFLNMLIQNVEENLDPSFVEKVYAERLLGVYGKGYFDYYKQRLRLYPEYLITAAEEILREACSIDGGYPINLAFNIFREKTGIDDHELFMDLILDLENDFYIRTEDKQIQFRSKVLGDWWRLYYA